MDIGMITRWGAPVTGREKEAAALFQETMEYGKRLLGAGRLTYFEPYLLTSGDLGAEQGFIITKGPVTEVLGILDTEDYRSLMARAELVLTHLHTEMLTVGEGIKRTLDDQRKALESIGV